MKKSEIKLNHTYIAKISGNLTAVKILSESPYGGWIGRNEKTGWEVRIKSAQKLRYEIPKNEIMGYPVKVVKVGSIHGDITLVPGESYLKAKWMAYRLSEKNGDKL